MKERFKAYKFFAHLFSYPENREEFFQKLKEFYPFEDKQPLESLERIPFEEIQAEYTSLFIARFPKVPCKPYQSFFESQTLMGNATFETEKFYSLFGLDWGDELPDRANLQLDFAAFLLELERRLSQPDERRKVEKLFKEFFKRHIAWMEKLARCVEDNTRLEPLKGLMEYFKDFLKEEKKLLDFKTL
jgi:TorA maturation chaperone TorD